MSAPKRLESDFNEIMDKLPFLSDRDKRMMRIMFFSGAGSAATILTEASEDAVGGVQTVQEFGAELMAFKADMNS